MLPERDAAAVDGALRFTAALERRVSGALARRPGGPDISGEELGRWLEENGPWFTPAEAATVGLEQLDAFRSPGRLAFRLGDRAMLKVAYLEAGRRANARESSLSTDPGVAPWVARVAEHGVVFDWVVVPLLRPIPDEEPLPEAALRALVGAVADPGDRRRWGFGGLPSMVNYGDPPRPAGGLLAALRRFLGGA